MAPAAPVAPTAPPPAAPPVAAASTAAVYVPDMSHVGQPLPDGVFAWDSLMKSVDAAADQPKADFVFNFTNVTAGKIAIINVHPSCGCTTAKLPPLPWIIPPGGTGQLPISVNLAGKMGTLFKTVTFTTEKGNKQLMLRINIQPRVIPTLSDADRQRGVDMAKVDRQAVFKGECAQCHVFAGNGKYGKELFDTVCAVCHEAEHRATMVPDLHNLRVPTNEDFWRTWITYGKPGSLMPAFAASQGGPLNDMQIASLAAYLSAVIPSHVPPPEFK
jgi:mono/diheme cytochrome c family protein